MKENLVILDLDFLKGRGQNRELPLVKPRKTNWWLPKSVLSKWFEKLIEHSHGGIFSELAKLLVERNVLFLAEALNL